MADASTDYASRNDYYVKIRGLHSGVSVQFKAIITSFRDSFTPSWNEEMVYGRNDPIMTFQGTKREIEMSLEVPAYNEFDAEYNLTQLSQLAASMYPGYSDTNSATTISTAPIHKIKFANWVTSGGTIGAVEEAGLVVALKGVSFDPIMDAGVIENGPKILPKLFNLNLSMTILHTDQVGWNPTGWLGSRRYPYTEKAEEISLNNPEPNEPIESSFENFYGQTEEEYQQALQDEILGSGLGQSLDSSLIE